MSGGRCSNDAPRRQRRIVGRNLAAWGPGRVIHIHEKLVPEIEAPVRRAFRQLLLRRIAWMVFLQMVLRLDQAVRAERPGQEIRQRAVGLGEDHAKGERINDFERHRLAADAKHRRHDRRDVPVAMDVLPGKPHILGRHLLPVRPPHPLAKVDCERLRVAAHLPAPGDVGDDRLAVRGKAQQRRVEHVLRLVELLRLARQHAHLPAISADLLIRADDHRLNRQTLLDGRQFSFLDELAEHRGFAVCAGMRCRRRHGPCQQP
jgi:hypothetical protein